MKTCIAASLQPCSAQSIPAHKPSTKPATQALHRLIALAEHDVRTCLNTLQLLSRRASRITAASISAGTVGHKDMTQSAFRVWRSLLEQ